MTIAETWYDEIEDDQLKREDVERMVAYAHDLGRGLAALRRYPQGVSIFGSARTKETSPYYQKAQDLGRLIARSGHTVITGGGPGIMEAANRGAFEAGGRSIGLNIKLPKEQFINKYVTESLEFRYFFARKVMLAFSSKVYVYFPGGFGTFDELGELLVLIQEGKVPKSPIFLFGKEFWRPLDDFFRSKMEEADEKYIAVGDRDLYTITNDINEIVSCVNQVEPKDIDWLMGQHLDRVLSSTKYYNKQPEYPTLNSKHSQGQ
jgi:uncharacterized protein (TIGR00730 family)